MTLDISNDLDEAGSLHSRTVAAGLSGMTSLSSSNNMHRRDPIRDTTIRQSNQLTMTKARLTLLEVTTRTRRIGGPDQTSSP